MSATGQLHGRLRAVCRVRCHTSGEPTGGRTFWSFEPFTQWVGGTKCPARSRPHDDRPNQSSIYEGARSPDQVADEATAPSRPANWSSALADHPPLGSVSPVSESRTVTGHRSPTGAVQEPQTSRAADVRMDVLRAATAPVSSRNAGSAATGFGAFRNHAWVSRL